jgi:hypothetical protein
MEHATAFRGLFLVVGIALSLLLMSVGWVSVGGASQVKRRAGRFGETFGDRICVEEEAYVVLQKYDPGWDSEDDGACCDRPDEDGGSGDDVLG